MRRETGGGEYHFIVNPAARSGLGGMIWKRIEPELKKRWVPYHCHLTKKRRHAMKIAESITTDGQEYTLVVLGGDGTLNEVINGIKDLEKVTLGYIPIGSSNDFARGLKLPADPGQALDNILHPGKTLLLDVGVLTRREKSRRFIVSAGVGFDAAVCHEVCVSRWKVFLNRIGLGKLSYAAVALDRLKKDRPVRLEMTFPGGAKKVFEHTYFAAFMNLPYEGGGFRFCPAASADDGLLDIIVMYGVPMPKRILLLFLSLFGKHAAFKGAEIHRCREVGISMDRPLPLHTDGEPGFLQRDIRVSVMEKRLKIIV